MTLTTSSDHPFQTPSAMGHSERTTMKREVDDDIEVLLGGQELTESALVDAELGQQLSTQSHVAGVIHCQKHQLNIEHQLSVDTAMPVETTSNACCDDESITTTAPSSCDEDATCINKTVGQGKLCQGTVDEHSTTKATSTSATSTSSAAAGKSFAIRKICCSGAVVIAIVAFVILVCFGKKLWSADDAGLSFVENNSPLFNAQQVIPWESASFSGYQGGLQLEIVNALDTKWYAEFQTAVYQWDNGSPDALTLSIREDSPDSTCSHVAGRLKVCNGNYGETHWLGINELLVHKGLIVASAARMNDFYLDRANEALRQYTMCHEVGHGFGLPHLDENENNDDLGSCMDYTKHPWRNQQPNNMNFDRLSKTYGTVNTRSRRDTAVANQDLVLMEKPIVHPTWVMPAFSHALSQHRELGHEQGEKLGWTVSKSRNGEIHTHALGDNYMASVFIVFATK